MYNHKPQKNFKSSVSLGNSYDQTTALFSLALPPGITQDNIAFKNHGSFTLSDSDLFDRNSAIEIAEIMKVLSSPIDSDRNRNLLVEDKDNNLAGIKKRISADTYGVLPSTDICYYKDEHDLDENEKNDMESTPFYTDGRIDGPTQLEDKLEHKLIIIDYENSETEHDKKLELTRAYSKKIKNRNKAIAKAKRYFDIEKTCLNTNGKLRGVTKNGKARKYKKVNLSAAQKKSRAAAKLRREKKQGLINP